MSTDFPSGVSSRGIPQIGSLLTTGAVKFVQSAHSLAADAPAAGTQRRPFATLDYAIGQCSANNDDHIIVMPGHEETITADGGINFDVGGVQVIGVGRQYLRPKISLGAAAAAIAVSAANCSMQNFQVQANFADVTNGIDVVAKGFALKNTHFSEAGADLNFIDLISASSTVDNTADGLEITHCTGFAVDASTNSPLLINGDVTDLLFSHNRFNIRTSNAEAMIECASGKVLRNVAVLWNFYLSLKTSGDILVQNNQAANSGWIAHNRALHADTDSEVLVDCDGAAYFDNLGTAVVTASGYLLPAADS